MRDLDAARVHSIAAAAENAESGTVGRLVASLEQPLHAETDAEQRAALSDACQNRFHPGGVERARRAEVSDTRHDHTVCLRKILRPPGHNHVRTQRREGLFHRGQIPCAVINQGDHSQQPLGTWEHLSEPFVLRTGDAQRACERLEHGLDLVMT